MGDLFLHLPFARRLRFAEGLHPIAAEAMVRRAPAVVLGAALPFLPEIERQRANWFRRLFMGGAQEAAKWRKQLENRDGPPRSEFVIALLSGEEGGANAPGPMTRLAFGIGAASTEVLSASIQPVLAGLEGSQREAVTGALARLWLQKTMPNLGGLPAEWRPAQRLQESENLKPLLVHLEAAMKTAFGDSPGRDGLQRWVKSLSTEMAPLLQSGGLPPETSIPLHEVESKYFNGDDKFLVRAQEALTRTVYLANRVAECFLGQDATKAQLSDALTEQAGALRDVPSNDVLDGVATKWKSRVADVREDALHRGRNPEAAFKEGEDGLLEGLPDLPPLPQDASGQNAAAPGGTPNVTQEVSLSQIEAEMGKAGRATADEAVAKPESSAGESGDANTPPAAPANTQQVSVADIEAEVEASQAGDPASPAPPTSTQQISTADIEEEVVNASPTADAPTTTQQISAVDIQAEMDAASDASAEGQEQPPAPPTTTQQISAVDIQAEMEAAGASAESASAESKGGFSAPAHTQQVSLSDIEAEVNAANPPPAPSTSSEGEPEPPPLPETALPPGQAQPSASADPQAAAGLAPPEGVSDDGNAGQASASADAVATDGAVGGPADADAADSAATDGAATDSAATDSAATDSAATDSAAADSTAAEAAATDSVATESAATDGAAADSAATDGAAAAGGTENAAEASEPDAEQATSESSEEEEPSDPDAAKAAEGEGDEKAAENGTSEAAQEADAAETPEGDGDEKAPEIRPLPGPSGTPS